MNKDMDCSFQVLAESLIGIHQEQQRVEERRYVEVHDESPIHFRSRYALTVGSPLRT